MSLLVATWRGLVLAALALVAPAALLLTTTAETARGTAAGGVGLLAAAVLVALLFDRRRAALVLAAAFAGGFGVLALRVPPPEPPSSTFHSSPLPWSMSQLVPEIDQVRVGIAVASRLDPFIDRAQAERIAERLLPAYRALDTARRRSAMTFAYAELFGGPQASGHRYWSVPKTSTDTRPPALIFLHGSAGNFAAYPAVLAPLNAIVVAPTSGFGVYLDPDATAATIADARRFAVETLGADPERVFLAAISQGGAGATVYAKDRQDLRGLILLSPIIDPQAAARWRGPDVLVLHGADDRRIARDGIEAAVEQLSTHTASISARYFEGEDHFLLYGRPARVRAAIQTWMNARP